MASALAGAMTNNSEALIADAIVDLINKRPQSPRREEIEDLVRSMIRSNEQLGPCDRCSALDREYGQATRRP